MPEIRMVIQICATRAEVLWHDSTRRRGGRRYKREWLRSKRDMGAQRALETPGCKLEDLIFPKDAR